jgi:hypothetical protein
MSEHPWVFVEDIPDAASAFAGALSEGKLGVSMRTIMPQLARSDLLTGKIRTAGVLMDVDLSAVAGEHGTGLGIAQDLRAKQKSGDVEEYPIVRFARREPVAKNIGGDPASNDLFDLRIDKNEATADRQSVQIRLRGARQVYDDLSAREHLDQDAIEAVLGLDKEKLELWSHAGLHARLADGREAAVHVAAGTLMRGLMFLAGPLINDDLLAIRLGIDIRATGESWHKLKGKFSEFRFQGTAHSYFERWWARGLESWWMGASQGRSSLPALTISERVTVLSKLFGDGKFVPLQMPKGSAGDRPWRMCALSMEEDEPVVVPIDPSAAVRITSRSDLPPWADPLYAAFGSALRATHDKRLNQSDIDRLKQKFR